MIDDNSTPLNLKAENFALTNKTEHFKALHDSWKRKELHGRHLHELEEAQVDKSASNKWLHLGEFFPETEGFLLAIQDQVISTKNYRKYILKDNEK